MPADESPSTHTTELEILITHLQEDFQKLNSVVLDQQRQIAELVKTVERLDGKLQKLGEEPETRDPLQERPPHY